MQALFGNVVLSNVSMLMRDVLPHEFEQLLAQLLSVAHALYIALPAAPTPAEAAFLKFWADWYDVLGNACDVAGLLVAGCWVLLQPTVFALLHIRRARMHGS